MSSTIKSKKSYLLLSILTLSLLPISTPAQITIEPQSNQRHSFSENPSEVVPDVPNPPAREDLLPFVERYRRARLRHSTLNNPELQELEPAYIEETIESPSELSN